MHLRRGLVIKSTGSHYRVQCEDGHIAECVIKGKFRIKGIKSTNPVTVGDFVLYEPDSSDTGVIREIEKRKNYIIRKSPKLSRQYQIIAANIDHVLLLATLREPVTPVEFIDRFLVAAESFRIPVKIIFNKTDIYTKKDHVQLKYLSDVYRKAGYDCYSMSLTENIEENLINGLVKGKITLVSGNSGVGKSTLLNIVDPGYNIKIDNISRYHKQGKHTTTFAEMYQVKEGGYVIDTPGIKGFGLIDMEKEEIYHFFPEIFRISEKCRYYNCLHNDEPGCAVKEAVDAGEIEWFRYRSYLNIMLDSNSKYR